MQYVRLWIDSPQVPAGVDCDGPQGELFSGCSVMDLTEFEAYGVPGPPELDDVQVLSFNNFQGHLLANDAPLSAQLDPTQTPVGGVEYLASLVKALRAGEPNATITAAAGDLIGSSPQLSSQFKDQPTIEALDERLLSMRAGFIAHTTPSVSVRSSAKKAATYGDQVKSISRVGAPWCCISASH